MTIFLLGTIIGILIGVLLGAYSSKIGNITDQITNITGGKQVIKDSPGGIISAKMTSTTDVKEKKRIFGFLLNKFKRKKDEKL